MNTSGRDASRAKLSFAILPTSSTVLALPAPMVTDIAGWSKPYFARSLPSLSTSFDMFADDNCDNSPSTAV